MNTLRVDRDRFQSILKSKRMHQIDLERILECGDEYIRSFKDEEYPGISRLADRCGVNPFLLLTVEVDTGDLVVDSKRALEAIHAVGVTRDEIAREWGVARNTMHNLTHYRWRKLSNIARAMGVSPLALLRVDQEEG